MSFILFILKRIYRFIWPPVKIYTSKQDFIIEKDCTVPLRDKSYLSINIFRPNDNLLHPVIISCHPYGKDAFPKKGLFGYSPPFQYRLIRQTGQVRSSHLTTWEAPDPDFWVNHGYVLINADMRGAGKSPGKIAVLSTQEAEDYFDLIEWAGTQVWSNGKVGLCGVSYLALSQYHTAALQPPHLAAICPWEGFSDVYKDLGRPGGIREDGFFQFWAKNIDADLRVQQEKRLLRDEWWQEKVADLTKINVPALVCGSFSDHCLHSVGSHRVFQQISSPYKWLYTHRNGKWTEFYGQEALALQLKFFDYFLKGGKNDMLQVPRVRLEVREDGQHIYRIRHEHEFPLKETQWQPLYLDVKTSCLSETIPTANQQRLELNKGQLCFNFTIPNDIEIIGPMNLSVYLKANENNDANIFVGIHKVHDDKTVYFEGSYGYCYDLLTRGQQRASLRKVEAVERPIWDPLLLFNEQKLLNPQQIVKLDIPLAPSATFFKAHDKLQLIIKGNAITPFNPLLSQLGKYEKTTSGSCDILSGGELASVLWVPFVG